MECDEEFQPISPSEFYGKRYRTFGLAADDVKNSDYHNIAVVVIPPDADYQTDNDEIDDGDLQFDCLINDVP